MRRLLLTLAAFVCLAIIPQSVRAQQADPCLSPAIHKLSVVINIASATTTSIIAPVTDAKIYICGFSLTISGTTNPSFQLEYGTGATCGTGTVVLTGSFLGGAATAPTHIMHDKTVEVSPVSQRICVVTGGTAPNAQGVLTYTQAIAN